MIVTFCTKAFLLQVQYVPTVLYVKHKALNGSSQKNYLSVKLIVTAKESFSKSNDNLQKQKSCAKNKRYVSGRIPMETETGRKQC